MNIGYHSNFMDRIIERADKRQERMEKMINKMLDKSEPILNAGKPKPQTNEEWIKSLDTEQLAKRLHDKDVYAFFVCRNGGKVPSVEHYVSWLKEIHK